jgi:hypothetical protein
MYHHHEDRRDGGISCFAATEKLGIPFPHHYWIQYNSTVPSQVRAGRNTDGRNARMNKRTAINSTVLIVAHAAIHCPGPFFLPCHISPCVPLVWALPPPSLLHYDGASSHLIVCLDDYNGEDVGHTMFDDCLYEYISRSHGMHHQNMAEAAETITHLDALCRAVCRR